MKYLQLRGTLNHNHFERIIQLVTMNSNEFVLDLSNIRFIEPYGLVGLITAARYCKNNGTSLKIILPPFNVQMYMERMGFFQTVQEYQNTNPNKFIQFYPIKPERPLLELKKLDMSNGFNEFVIFTELLDKRMDMMFNSTQNVTALRRITTNLLEVCQNIEHSLDVGYVAAQKYLDLKLIRISVMDLGIGIKQALQKYGKKGEELSDKRAIGLALQPQVSSRPSGGGLGLYQLANYVKENAGSELIIRTGTVKYSLKHTGSVVTENLPLFPGTQVDLSIKTTNK